MSRFDSVLIANRGEIAVRVMRTARRLGLRTIAVYSDADAQAPHVQAADQAVHIGPAPVGESYLRIDRILAAAAASGAGAVHPGYGFLSENAAFARAVLEAGLVFIGPSPDAIELMGNKAAAKRRMQQAGVPCVPGYEGEDQTDDAFAAAAERIGYPVMVKAAAGGGGRGMRLVPQAGELPAALRTARSEARNAFGSDELILEKAIARPRHVEVQVFADEHGQVVHLGERDCSVQRRHQKVVEEAPCPVLSPELRARMGASAVEAARSIGYRGAGTVEFLLDADGRYWFLEMNTRLQVEHPVTECITGLDLVELQLRVAQGAPLGLAQPDVRLHGHAIEVRLYAEDPAQAFLPVSGRVREWRAPEGEGIRVDAGIRSGLVVTPHYDPLLAKLVARGDTREEAIDRLVAALGRTRIFGLRTNREFLRDVLSRPAFRRGEATTAFIAEEFGGAWSPAAPTTQTLAQAAVLQFAAARAAALDRSLAPRTELADWASTGRAPGWRTRYRPQGAFVDVHVQPLRGDAYDVEVGEVRHRVELPPQGSAMNVDGRRSELAWSHEPPATLHVDTGAGVHTLCNLLAAAADGEASQAGDGRVVAVMHGVLVESCAQEGQRVRMGERLGVLEAMKMQHDVRAPLAGVVRTVAVRAGAQVAAGDLLYEIEPGPDAAE